MLQVKEEYNNLESLGAQWACTYTSDSCAEESNNERQELLRNGNSQH